MSFCKSCRCKSLIRDEVSGNLLCSSCGIFQDFDNFEAQINGLSGPQGTFVRVGTIGAGSVLNYKEKKIYDAGRIIDDMVFKFELSGSVGDSVRKMVSEITEGEYGRGEWFLVLVGACVYVAMRKEGRSLPISEVASAVGCDDHNIGRMVMRVVEFLDLKREEYPGFDIVGLMERAIRNLPCFSRLGKEDLGKILEQGTFFMQCTMKWSLATGRRPLPLVVAVLALVAELNNVDATIENIAKEHHTIVSTSKKRYKELLGDLVKVAQALPWGKDITVKNIIKNVPFVIQYMEHKSMLKPRGKQKDLSNVRFDLGNVVSECVREEIEYESGVNGKDDESQYFRSEVPGHCAAEIRQHDLRISHQCLPLIYKRFLKQTAGGKLMIEMVDERKRRMPPTPRTCTEWWEGKSDLTKKLLLEQLLEIDVGLDPMPPSFVSNCNQKEKRREKINAAKVRINQIMNPSDNKNRTEENVCVGKKRKVKPDNEVDWEDLIIETLLLHQVKEDEIEKGHYNALLALHVFNPVIEEKLHHSRDKS